MDIRHLEYFVEVAKERSFTRAAQNLHITQPTVSKMIRGLEEELGVPLFHRTGKVNEVTDAGKAILEQAQLIIGSFRQLSNELGDVLQLRKGNIRIGLPPTAGSVFFPRIIGSFRQAFPGIEIKLLEIGSRKVEHGIENNTLDVGITCNPPLHLEAYEFVSLLKDPLLVAVPPSHPLADRKELSISELRHETFAMYPEDFSLYAKIIDRCELHGFYPNIICQSSQWNFLCGMVEAELSVAIIPKVVCDTLDRSRVVCIPIAEADAASLHMHLSLLWKKNTYLSFAAKEWIRHCREVFEKP